MSLVKEDVGRSLFPKVAQRTIRMLPNILSLKFDSSFAFSKFDRFGGGRVDVKFLAGRIQLRREAETDFSFADSAKSFLVLLFEFVVEKLGVFLSHRHDGLFRLLRFALDGGVAPGEEGGNGEVTYNFINIANFHLKKPIATVTDQ